MSLLRLTLASLFYHWRTNLAVACGVAVGTAVLTGALLVGDSMQGSLRRLTIDRLGRIDEALVTSHFFRAALTDELHGETAPAVLLQATVENLSPSSHHCAARVSLVGCDDRFWRLGGGRPERLPGTREIVLNQATADRLGVRVGDVVLLRLPTLGAIPAESPFGKKRGTIRTERLAVSEIIAAEGLGAFSLRPTQRPPLNAYVALDWLERQLDRPGHVNAILVAGEHRGPLAPSLADYGLRVERTKRGYWDITSDRMMLDPAAEREILRCLGNRSESLDVQPAMTYLANTLSCHGREVPYSTITAIDFGDRPPLGPFRSADHKPLPPLGPDEIALNTWAAEQLHARVGDTVRLGFFEPESLDGRVRERSVDLRLAAIVELAGAADDRHLTPSVKGMTDKLTMAKWDPPFPFDDRRIRPADEEYWNRYGATPKAFVSLATGQQLWASRFGRTTSIRVSDKQDGSGWRDLFFGTSVSEAPPTFVPLDVGRLLQEQLDPAAMGFIFQPVKRQQLDASEGSTPFGVLFLCFSFFIIAAAVMLVALLFRLGIDRRATQIGTLLALGLSRRQVGRTLLGEGFAVAVVGSLLGVPVGIGYAALMLLGLQTWWLAAIATPFLRLHVTAASPAIGCVSGLIVAMAAIWLSVRRIARIPPRRLLAGATLLSPRPLGEGQGVRADQGSGFRDQGPEVRGQGSGAANHQITKSPNLQTRPALTLTLSQRERGAMWTLWIELVLVLLTIAPTAVLLLVHVGAELRTGMFFGAGAAALLTLMALVWLRLRTGMTGAAVTVGGGNLVRMALRNAARNPDRCTLTIGLVATASFIIVSVSVFRLDPTQQKATLHGGNGGFVLVAESDQPILQDLNSPHGRGALDFSQEDEKVLSGSTIIGLRANAGDDASCLNLYRPRQPRVLGLPRRFIDRGGFAWAAKRRDCPNPWLLLEENTGGKAIPVILDRNTANYALQLWGGLGETFEIDDGHGKPVQLQVVALLADSIFQGDLLIGESAFRRLFPNASGYRLFLVETSSPSEVRESLERNLGEYGFSAEATGRRMAELLAVQNTYLSTFQSLGGLGLLLGTLGLATVQLRNVLERRGELALLRATGFRRATLGWLVLLEHAALLAIGLAVGTLAASLAVWPHVSNRGAGVPWLSLAVTLAAVLVVGIAVGVVAVRTAVRAPLLAALREERA
jgi:putative ABC transport system permease protein